MKISFPLLLSLLANFISSSSVFERCTEGDLEYKVDPVAAGHLIKHGEDALQSYIQNREVAKVFDYYKRIIRLSNNAQVDLPVSLTTKLQSFVENVMIRPASNSVNQLKYLNQMKERSPKDLTEKLESILDELSVKSDGICLAFSELGEISAILANETAKSNIEKVRKELRKFATDRILDSKNFCEEFDDIVEKVTMCLQDNTPMDDIVQDEFEVFTCGDDEDDFFGDEDQFLDEEDDDSSPDLLSFTAGRDDCLATNQLQETISRLSESTNLEGKLVKINEGLDLLCDTSDPARQALCDKYRDQIKSKVSFLVKNMFRQRVLTTLENVSNSLVGYLNGGVKLSYNDHTRIKDELNSTISNLTSIQSINISLSQIKLHVDTDVYMDELVKLLVKYSNDFMNLFVNSPLELLETFDLESKISEIILYVFNYFKNDSDRVLPLQKLIDLATIDADPEWANVWLAFTDPDSLHYKPFDKMKQLQLLHSRIVIEVSHMKQQLEALRGKPEMYRKIGRQNLNREIDAILNVFLSSASFASTLIEDLINQCAEGNDNEFVDVEVREKLIDNIKLYLVGKRGAKTDIEVLRVGCLRGKLENKPSSEPVVNTQPAIEEDHDLQLAIQMSLNQEGDF